MVPSGLRSSWARPAVSWPRAARRSARRTSRLGFLETAVGARQFFHGFLRFVLFLLVRLG